MLWSMILVSALFGLIVGAFLGVLLIGRRMEKEIAAQILLQMRQAELVLTSHSFLSSLIEQRATIKKHREKMTEQFVGDDGMLRRRLKEPYRTMLKGKNDTFVATKGHEALKMKTCPTVPSAFPGVELADASDDERIRSIVAFGERLLNGLLTRTRSHLEALVRSDGVALDEDHLGRGTGKTLAQLVWTLWMGYGADLYPGLDTQRMHDRDVEDELNRLKKIAAEIGLPGYEGRV